MNATLIDIIAASVVRRIALPRKLAGKVTRHGSLNAKLWTELSPHDRDDIRQSVAFALIAAGFPDKPAFRRADSAANDAAQRRAESDAAETFGAADKLARESAAISANERAEKTARAALKFVPLSAWRAAFISARSELRMGNRASDREMAADPLPIVGDESRLDLNNFHAPQADEKAEIVRRARLARRARYLRACIAASFSADLSRKRQAARIGATRFLRWLTAYAAGRGFGRLDFSGRAGDTRRDQALADAKRRFLAYIERGESVLTASAMNGIPQRIATEFKSFAMVPAGAFGE